jgi:hypothetical protein
LIGGENLDLDAAVALLCHFLSDLVHLDRRGMVRGILPGEIEGDLRCRKGGTRQNEQHAGDQCSTQGKTFLVRSHRHPLLFVKSG